jgi:hypothetical protein
MEQYELLRHAARCFEKHGIRYFVTGAARARRLRPLEDTEVDFASPEDVILKKMAFYRDGGSEKHLRDIAGILKISSGGIDLAYIEGWAKKLGLEEIWAAFLPSIPV